LAAAGAGVICVPDDELEGGAYTPPLDCEICRRDALRGLDAVGATATIASTPGLDQDNTTNTSDGGDDLTYAMTGGGIGLTPSMGALTRLFQADRVTRLGTHADHPSAELFPWRPCGVAGSGDRTSSPAALPSTIRPQVSHRWHRRARSSASP